MKFFNWFIDPVKNQYADFTGRATRKQYWMFALIYLVIYIVLGFVDSMLGLNFQTIGLLSMLFWLATLAPAFAIGARRLHDTGLSGWWQLISLIPIIGWIIVIVLLVRKSQSGPNKYGNPAGAPVSASPVSPEASGMSDDSSNQ